MGVVDVALLQVATVKGCDCVCDDTGLEINFDLARSYCLRKKLDIRERFLFNDFSCVELVVTDNVFFCSCDDDEDKEDLSSVLGKIS